MIVFPGSSKLHTSMLQLFSLHSGSCQEEKQNSFLTEWQFLCSTDTCSLLWSFQNQSHFWHNVVLLNTKEIGLELLDDVYCHFSSGSCFYWAIQAGLLTPLTFARHHLSPLAAFTSSAYFLHNGRWWQWICEFYTANVKGIFWGT